MAGENENHDVGFIERWTVLSFLILGYLICLPLIPYIVNIVLSDTVPPIVRWVPVTMSIVLSHLVFTVYSRQYSPAFYRINMAWLKLLGQLTTRVIKSTPKVTLWMGRTASKLVIAIQRLSSRVISRFNNR